MPNRSVSGTPTLAAAYSEGRQYLGPQGDQAPSASPAGDAARADTLIVAYPGFLSTGLIQGGERYEQISLTTPGRLTLSSVGIQFTAVRATARDYRGWFDSSSALLNRIWFDGAYTTQLDEIPANSVPPAWQIVAPPGPPEMVVPPFGGWPFEGLLAVGASPVTVTSVPTPYSEASTLDSAFFTPAEAALTVTTWPIPTARPIAASRAAAASVMPNGCSTIASRLPTSCPTKDPPTFSNRRRATVTPGSLCIAGGGLMRRKQPGKLRRRRPR